jgi:hypothetical protein
MFSGAGLSNGRYDERKVSDDDLWSVMSNAFSSKSVNSSSYKIGLFKALLDKLWSVDDNLCLSFDEIFGRFTEVYWNLIFKYKLRQMPKHSRGNVTALEKELFAARDFYGIPDDTPFESLPDSARAVLSQNVKIACKKMVVGALYGDTDGLLYSFDRKNEWLQFNPIAYQFLQKHKLVLEKLNYHEWAKYLEKINPEMYTAGLIGKLDRRPERISLQIFRHILRDEFETNNCFYCGKKLRDEDHTEVDHFIPWSFIKDDNLWNLVLACRDCNNNKRDKLPNERYVKKIIIRNSLLLTIPEYKQRLHGYNENRVIDTYDWAMSNGFDQIWEPRQLR